MSDKTVRQLAAMVKTPLDQVLKQLKEAGLSASSGDDVINDEQQMQLLSHLRKSHGKKAQGTGDNSPKRVTLERRKVSEIKQASVPSSSTKTISVEVRKKKTYIERPNIESVGTTKTDKIEPEEPKIATSKTPEIIINKPVKTEFDISIEIQNLKSIKNFSLCFPFKEGLYALTGENGVGKSTILAALARLVYTGALFKYFKNDGNENTSIKFSHNGITNEWIKSLNWIRRHEEQNDIFLDGTFEASLMFGSRFDDTHKSKLGKGEYINEQDLIDADKFISENLGLILRNEPTYYSNLKRIKSKTLAKEKGFDSQPHFLNVEGKYLSQFFMSSGEMLLIELLRFVSDKLSHKSRKEITSISLMLIDEIELALHPSAQFRLIKFLDELSSKYNFCVIFATHSLCLINNIKPSNIFHIQRNIENNLEVINPCYPAYATRSLYTNDGFDFLFLVEDDLAKIFIEKIIHKNKLTNSKLIKVLPCGSWEQTLKIHQDFKSSHMAGRNCKIFSILDGDIKSEYEKRETEEWKVLYKNFLPIDSIEKYLKKYLLDTPDSDFYKLLNDRFFSCQSIEDIVLGYKNKTKPKTDNNGKILFMVLVACAKEQQNEDVFKYELCNIIFERSDTSALTKFLINAVS
jgi:predicted ATPase